ncbi:hypothetical protein DJ80_05390 [Halorubrum ezzemoulense]|uniref:Uncharacterized protein n=1 Tax=Halorubrum ezzemoulense TaxID=337243 RepID=A0A256J676_HALEZ|nr:hypothetical protein DJ80_05390 [Halorubrum ezzemoulense]
MGVEIDTRIAEIAPGDRLIDEISVHARVAEPEEPPDGEGPSDDGDEDDDPSPTTGPIVSVDRPSPSVREVTLRSVVGGEETAVDLGGLRVGDPAIRLDRLTFVRESPGDVEFAVRGLSDRPAEAPPPPPGAGPERGEPLRRGGRAWRAPDGRGRHREPRAGPRKGRDDPGRDCRRRGGRERRSGRGRYRPGCDGDRVGDGSVQ